METAGHPEPDGERAASQKSPDAFRTISEVSSDLDVPQHVLRFWEGKFAQIKPLKRGGGRRYYRPEDVDLLRGIQHLLYGDGYTIKGVQKLLRENGVKFVVASGRREPPAGRARPVPAVTEPVSAPVVTGEVPPTGGAGVAKEPPAPPSASLGGAPNFTPAAAPLASTPEPDPEPEFTLAPPEPEPVVAAPMAAPSPPAEPEPAAPESAAPETATPETAMAIDEAAESRRIETAARLLARLKALRRDFDTRLQAAKNGR